MEMINSLIKKPKEIDDIWEWRKIDLFINVIFMGFLTKKYEVTLPVIKDKRKILKSFLALIVALVISFLLFADWEYIQNDPISILRIFSKNRIGSYGKIPIMEGYIWLFVSFLFIGRFIGFTVLGYEATFLPRDGIIEFKSKVKNIFDLFVKYLDLIAAVVTFLLLIFSR